MPASPRRRSRSKAPRWPAAVPLGCACLLVGCGVAPAPPVETAEAWTPEPTRVDQTLGWTRPASPRPTDFLPLDESGLRGLSPFVLESWFPPQWAAMGLDPLYTRAGEAGVEVYRFVEVPTWQPTYAITLEVDPARMTDEPKLPERGKGAEAAGAARAACSDWATVPAGRLHYVTLGGSGGYDPGTVAARGERAVAQGEAAAFRKLFAAAGFWNERTQDPSTGRDGSTWVLEVLRGGRYHVVERWSPAYQGEAKAGTEAFVAMAHWLQEAAVPRPLRGTPADR